MIKPETYRGWHIGRGRWPEPAWVAYSPDYDASYEGPEDGWVDNGQKADGVTREHLIEEIDAWFAENEPDLQRTPSGLSLPESDSADHLGVVIGRKEDA